MRVSEGQGHAQHSQYFSRLAYYPHDESDHLGDRPPRTDRSIASDRTLATAARDFGHFRRASRGCVVPYR